MTDGQKLYLFDPHSRDHLGMISEYGTSVLIKFRDISHLVKLKLAGYMTSNLDVQFKITGITSVVKHYSYNHNVALNSVKPDSVIITNDGEAEKITFHDQNVALNSDQQDSAITSNVTEAEIITFHDQNVALNLDMQDSVIITNVTETEKFTFQSLSLCEKESLCAQLKFCCFFFTWKRLHFCLFQLVHLQKLNPSLQMATVSSGLFLGH